jgi:ribonuclease P protein component
MAKQFTLGKKERLKSRKAIEQLFTAGKKITIQPFRVFYLHQADKGLLLGTGVSTKNFSHATDRNRVKRLIREAWRLQKNKLAERLDQQNRGLHVFIIFTAGEKPRFEPVMDTINKLIHKLMDTP